MLEIFKSVTIEKKSDVPLYMQLFEKIREMISNGILLPDYRLPSIRQLSNALDINQVTVVSAFKQLEAEGFIYKRQGSGTYVSNLFTVKNSTDEGLIQDELYYQDDISLINTGQIKINEDTVNFASATPTPDLFPVEDFKLVLNEVLERDMGNAFGYQDSQGFLPLRESFSQLLTRDKINSRIQNIQVISGAQQGIDIISKALLKQGDYVITESPTYTGAIAVFKSRGAEIADVEYEKDGPNLNILEYNLKKYKPKFIYSIPTFQNPTGYSYSNYKRQEMLKLAKKYNVYIIEDDYVSSLNFTDSCFTPIKAIDTHDRVIFIKSFSKIFMPGLRLGFMIVPNDLQANILEAKHTTDISTSGLIQRAFDMYIRKGFWDKHFRFMYDVYKERYLCTINSLDRHLPGCINYSKPGGGLNIWLNLPPGFPVSTMFKQATTNNIVFAPGRIFFSSTSTQEFNSIRISFAAVYAHQIEKGISELCSMFKALSSKNEYKRNIPIL